MKGIFKISILLLVVSLAACELDDPKVSYSPTFPLDGEWGVVYRVETSPGVFEDIHHAGYTPITISGTAANTGDSIWISDNENFWDFKIKAAAQAKARTFSTEGSISIIPDYDINVVVTNGEVFLKSVVTRGAHATTDSIYMQLEFEDEPGVIYHCSGVRRTGFLEDDEYYGF